MPRSCTAHPPFGPASGPRYASGVRSRHWLEARARCAGMVSLRGAARLPHGWRGGTPTARCRWPTGRPPWQGRIWSCWRPRPISSDMSRTACGRCSARSSFMLRTAARAAAIGRRAGDADLVALALVLHGRAMVRQGRVGEGLVLLDEAMVAVVAGELSPPVAGTVYCSVIDACQEVLEWRRAKEWTAALAAWCGKQTDMITFTGQCLVHRAEILQLHGAWPQAVEEAKRAGERLTQGADGYASGSAFYQQAEVYRVLGDFTAAENAYRPLASMADSAPRACSG